VVEPEHLGLEARLVADVLAAHVTREVGEPLVATEPATAGRGAEAALLRRLTETPRLLRLEATLLGLSAEPTLRRGRTEAALLRRGSAEATLLRRGSAEAALLGLRTEAPLLRLSAEAALLRRGSAEATLLRLLRAETTLLRLLRAEATLLRLLRAEATLLRLLRAEATLLRLRTVLGLLRGRRAVLRLLRGRRAVLRLLRCAVATQRGGGLRNARRPGATEAARGHFEAAHDGGVMRGLTGRLLTVRAGLLPIRAGLLPVALVGVGVCTRLLSITLIGIGVATRLLRGLLTVSLIRVGVRARLSGLLRRPLATRRPLTSRRISSSTLHDDWCPFSRAPRTRRRLVPHHRRGLHGASTTR
jgi:hypothetical protein